MEDNMLGSSRRRVDPFLTGAVWVTVLGCLVATAVPGLLSDSPAFRGSLTFSGLVSVSFALQNVRTFLESSRPELPASLVTTVFGVWFVVAPLRYAQAGAAATATAQAAGLIVAAFAGYCAVVALIDSRADT